MSQTSSGFRVVIEGQIQGDSQYVQRRENEIINRIQDNINNLLLDYGDSIQMASFEGETGSGNLIGSQARKRTS